MSLALEGDVYELVGSAAVLSMRSGTLVEQGQRIVDLTTVLNEAFTVR